MKNSKPVPMKQYTTPEQTAKLIELGFEKPKSISGYYQRGPYEYDAETNTKMVVYDDTQYPIYAYSIGELLSILPQTINVFYDLAILSSHKGWWVLYGMIGDGDIWSIEHEVYENNIVDALYYMILRLKEEEVI
jgi:hypothetical protein